jgi:DNA-binding SARP family transcriptional activator/DNA-binding beta-propeller fold protein YncE
VREAGTCPHLAVLDPVRVASYRRVTTALDFRVLGPLEVAANGTFLPLGGAKQRAVLALLVLNANEVVPLDRIIDELWGETPPESAPNMVHGYVSRLRKTLEPDHGRGKHELLVSRSPGYVLQIEMEQLDAERFADLTREGRRLLHGGDVTAAAERFRAALALWRGPPLGDLAYEPFAQREAERFDELRLAALEDRIDADFALGRHADLVVELRELVERYPLRERLRAQLMAALYRSGRQAEALEVYRLGRQLLSEELGIEPGPGLRKLERAILRHDPELGTPTPPPRPLVATVRRRSALLLGAAALAAAFTAALAFGISDGGGPVIVEPHSVAVIDTTSNKLVGDVPVGGYPGPLAANEKYVYVANAGDATISMILPKTKKVWGTNGSSRATDLVAVRDTLWSANGGTPGGTPVPPGTVTEDNYLAPDRIIRVGPSVDGAAEQTTVAADAHGFEVWAGNQDSGTVRRVTPSSSVVFHGIAPGGLAVVAGARADTVWASDPKRDRVVRIDGATMRIVARISVAGAPTRLAADSRDVWLVTVGTHPSAVRIDPKTNEQTARIPLRFMPKRIALGAGSVWVSGNRINNAGGESRGIVVRIDRRTAKIVARVSLGKPAADGILVRNGLVWVAAPPTA